MKKVLGVILAITMILGLAACGDTANTNSSKVENNDTVVVNELNEYLSTQELDEEELEDYREIYLRQYSNMDYKIKNVFL